MLLSPSEMLYDLTFCIWLFHVQESQKEDNDGWETVGKKKPARQSHKVRDQSPETYTLTHPFTDFLISSLFRSRRSSGKATNAQRANNTTQTTLKHTET